MLGIFLLDGEISVYQLKCFFDVEICFNFGVSDLRFRLAGCQRRGAGRGPGTQIFIPISQVNPQVRRERGGRDGNFYWGPRLKKRPKIAKFTSS